MIRIIILIIFNYKIFSCCCCRGNFMNSQDYKGYYSKSSSKSEKFNEDMKNVKNVKIPTGKKVVKKTIIISSNTNLYSAGELEKYYKELVRDVQKEVFNISDECESIENECYAKICYDFAMIARLAYFYVCKFVSNRSKEKTSKIQDDIKCEINNLCDKNNYSKYSNILKDYCMKKTLKFSNYMNKNERNDFFCRLIRVYLFCKLLNCKVDFNMPLDCDAYKECNKKLRDFINSGVKQKKINFVIFPSILYNGTYIGKMSQLVFTYGNRVDKKTKKSEFTYYFSDEKVKLLDKILSC